MRGRTVCTLLFCLQFLFLLSFFSCIGRYAFYHSFFVFSYLFVCFSPPLMKYFTQRKPVFSFRFVSFSLLKTNKQRSQQLRRRQEGHTHTKEKRSCKGLRVCVVGFQAAFTHRFRLFFVHIALRILNLL